MEQWNLINFVTEMVNYSGDQYCVQVQFSDPGNIWDINCGQQPLNGFSAHPTINFLQNKMFNF